jgi:hypothetical protein
MPLFGLSLPMVLGGALLAVSLLGGLYYAIDSNAEGRGWNKAIAAIAAKDKGAIDAARKLRSAADNCNDTGGVWDAARGKCDRR